MIFDDTILFWFEDFEAFETQHVDDHCSQVRWLQPTSGCSATATDHHRILPVLQATGRLWLQCLRCAEAQLCKAPLWQLMLVWNQFGIQTKWTCGSWVSALRFIIVNSLSSLSYSIMVLLSQDELIICACSFFCLSSHSHNKIGLQMKWSCIRQMPPSYF